MVCQGCKFVRSAGHFGAISRYLVPRNPFRLGGVSPLSEFSKSLSSLLTLSTSHREFTALVAA